MNVGRAGFVCTEPNGIQRRLSALCKVKLESAFSARLATPRLAVGLAIFVIAEAHVVSLKAPALRACEIREYFRYVDASCRRLLVIIAHHRLVVMDTQWRYVSFHRGLHRLFLTALDRKTLRYGNR